jgi:beta-lactamase superfamily II metal-dependent hydrolase
MSNGSDLNQLPADDEVEISVFGPGYGECIVAHLGQGDWIVVDSCKQAETRRPEALHYLEKLGLDPQVALKRIIATHWHDDHIGGMGELFESAKNAEFWCSMALSSLEWITLVELQRSAIPKWGSGVTEMRRVMDEIRKRTAKDGVGTPKFAMSGRPILTRAEGVAASVQTFAPSDAAVLSMHAEFQLLRNQVASRVSAVPSLKANDGSVVISLRVGDIAVLLGADLEERGLEGLGWRQVLADCETHFEQHHGFKIPHHGSQNGHHPEVWPRLMTKGAWSVLTPWTRGNGLPGKDEAERIMAESGGNAYITAPPRRTKYKHPDAAVQRTLREMGTTLYKDIGKQGHVRFRRSAMGSGPWCVELFGSATRLDSLEWA